MNTLQTIYARATVASVTVTTVLSTAPSERVIVDVDTNNSFDGPTWERIMLSHVITSIDGIVSVSGFLVDQETHRPDYDSFRIYKDVRRGGVRVIS